MSKKIPKKVQEVWNHKVEQNYQDNLHISYSKLVHYATCPKQWQALHLTEEFPVLPSIHMTFGTAIHETIQTWLNTLYNGKVKDADEMNLKVLLYENMIKAYIKDKERNNFNDFSSLEEMQTFYLDGQHILDYIKKKRRAYFTTKGVYLAGIETVLYRELQPKVYFKGKIDLVFYDERIDRWTIVDIKTSTKGWDKYQKADDNKKAQVLLYKHYFSEQFNIPSDKIDVLYFIVKRQIPIDADFASMQKRVQEFSPPAGPIKMKQATSLLSRFVSETIGEDGKYIQKEYKTTPSKDACRFCELKKNRVCPDAIF
jgi:hypothetical protein